MLLSPVLVSEIEIVEAAIQDKKQEIARVGSWLVKSPLEHERWPEGVKAYQRLQDELIVLDCNLTMAKIGRGE